MSNLRHGKIFPIGFHLGPGGNATGIVEDFMRPLDAAGIRFVIVSADAYPKDAAVLARASGIEHTIVWRTTKFDTPLHGYTGDPLYEADLHYAAVSEVIPEEFDKEYVYLSFLNEVDKNQSDWIGRFCKRWSEQAIAAGYKPLGIGWASGEPEPEQWLTPGMAEYLRFVAANNDRAAVAFHEYSYDVNDIYRWHPWLVGRYQKFIDACDSLGIKDVPFVIKEWGWEHDKVPVPERAISDIANIAWEYGKLRQNYGGALWYLGPGFGEIANSAQKLIAPVGDLALTWNEYIDWEDEVSPPVQGDCIATDKNTRFHLLRPREMSDAQWAYLKKLMVSGVDISGVGKVIIGYEGWTHTDSMDAIKTAVQKGYTDSRLVIMDGHLIGTGLDYAWMEANCPFLLPYTVWIRSDNGPLPGDPTIHNIVDDLPKSTTSSYSTRPRTDITQLIIHHTTGDPFQSIYNIASYHVNGKGWPGIGYHFVIDGAGKIYMTNYPETLSYHSNYANPYGMAICMQGNFMYTWPSNAQLAACRQLIAYLKREIPTITKPLIPHRDAPGASTQCPGDTYPEWWPALTGELPTEPPIEPPPASGPARLGLHASADPGLAAGEADMFATAKIDMVKILSNLPPEHASQLASKRPAAPFVIRVYQDGWERNITPSQFVEWNMPDVVRYMPILGGREVYGELHNEPNLVQEGLGYSWSDGRQFSNWLLPVISSYRTTLPEMKLVFPGLSPGGDVAGIRYDSTRFVQEAAEAIAACDVLGVHVYWQKDVWPMSVALGQLDAYRQLYPNKPIIVTEASNNRATTDQAGKGQEYIDFWRELKKRADVLGVTYFVASASNAAWGWQTGTGEVWLGTSIPQIVGSRT